MFSLMVNVMFALNALSKKAIELDKYMEFTAITRTVTGLLTCTTPWDGGVREIEWRATELGAEGTALYKACDEFNQSLHQAMMVKNIADKFTAPAPKQEGTTDSFGEALSKSRI